jgi:hypothetical protein
MFGRGRWLVVGAKPPGPVQPPGGPEARIVGRRPRAGTIAERNSSQASPVLCGNAFRGPGQVPEPIGGRFCGTNQSNLGETNWTIMRFFLSQICIWLCRKFADSERLTQECSP